MAEHSKIEWTGATWNIITGCSLKSPGCAGCYAMKLAGTRLRNHPSRVGLTVETKTGPVWSGEVRFNDQWLDQPLRWSKPRMIFVCAHGDLFHEDVPDAWIDRVFSVMLRGPRHTYQVLTKRAERMRDYVSRLYELAGRDDPEWFARGGVTSLRDGWRIPKHIWLGVSAEDQARADERIPHLLATPAAVRWVSAEPLLGPVDVADYLRPPPALSGRHVRLHHGHWIVDADGAHLMWTGLDWIVAGGESGPRARPMHPAWARSLRDQCQAADVPFFFKQHGDWREFDHRPETDEIDVGSELADSIVAVAHNPAWITHDGRVFHRQADLPDGVPCRLVERIGKARAGRLLDGREHSEFPR